MRSSDSDVIVFTVFQTLELMVDLSASETIFSELTLCVFLH